MAEREDRRSAAAELYREWYKTPEWHRIRGKRLDAEPDCRVCLRQKAFDPAFVIDRNQRMHVDHVTPHRGDWNLFADYDNTQVLCAYHHNSMKQAMEKRTIIGVDADGWPMGERP